MDTAKTSTKKKTLSNGDKSSSVADKKETLVAQYNQLTVELKEKSELRFKVLGALELIEQLESEKE